MTARELAEYSALRDTIRERGTARVWVFLVGLIAWATVTVATAALASLPIATLLPLLVLAAAFEALFSLHVGVERIGRYVQLFYEEEPGWEHAAMAFGRPAAGRADPLFAVVFGAGASRGTGTHRGRRGRRRPRSLHRPHRLRPLERRTSTRRRSRQIYGITK
jgi:hypothetical protein